LNYSLRYINNFIYLSTVAEMAPHGALKIQHTKLKTRKWRTDLAIIKIQDMTMQDLKMNDHW